MKGKESMLHTYWLLGLKNEKAICNTEEKSGEKTEMKPEDIDEKRKKSAAKTDEKPMETSENKEIENRAEDLKSSQDEDKTAEIRTDDRRLESEEREAFTRSPSTETTPIQFSDQADDDSPAKNAV